MKRWQDAVDRLDAEPGAPARTAANEILAMVSIDQGARQHLWIAEDPSLGDDDRLGVRKEIFSRLEVLDRRHVQRLRALIPKSGWFRNSRHGVQVTHGAWLILQHGRDTELMDRALARMAKLVRKREVSPHDYALLFDRVSRRQGRKQRFASQAMCPMAKGEVLVVPDVEDPALVDRRRAEIGWETSFAETKASLGVGRPCHW